MAGGSSSAGGGGARDSGAAGYRAATVHHLDELRAAGQLLWENTRYGATYAIDRDELLQRLLTKCLCCTADSTKPSPLSLQQPLTSAGS